MAPMNTEQLTLIEQPVDQNPDYIESVADLTPEKVERLKKLKPKLLGITCGRTDCKSALHCFDTPPKNSKFLPGTCRECGAELVKWHEMWSRDLRHVDKKFEYFRKEWIRHFFFHVPITSRVEKYARKNGLIGLASILEDQLRKEKMLRYIPALDWNQAKMLDGTIVHWARHAVACCCRGCMSYWHNVPLDHRLNDEDIEYFKKLALKYFLSRITDLKNEPE